MFNRITIIGLGLIGGSLGLAIKEKGIAKEIIGISKRRNTINKAVRLKVVDRATLDFKKGVEDSDLIILATPILKIVEIAKKIQPFLKKGAILIDTGSTKRYIVSEISRFKRRDVHFIGSHPIAGSEKTGVDYADKNLFRGNWCILTPDGQVDVKVLKKVIRFWKSLEMKVAIMGPPRHDRLVSMISHLPHIVSVGLVDIVDKKDLVFAGGGFKDITRIASGGPELWKDVFVTNRKNIIKDIELLRKVLSKIKYILNKNKTRELVYLLRRAKDTRDNL